MLGVAQTCPATPGVCVVSNNSVSAKRGTHTIGVHITGTCTAKAICTIAPGYQEATGYVGSTLTATGLMTSFTDSCDLINIELSSCASGTLDLACMNTWAPSN
jgi:hypothetical protein